MALEIYVWSIAYLCNIQLFSGPVAESLPTSVSAFAHRRVRADSTTSFTYYADEIEDEDMRTASPLESRRHSFATESARHSVIDIGDLDFGEVDDEDSADQDYDALQDDYMLRRRSSTHSQSSVHARLLRSDSAATASTSAYRGRQNQKIYMANEDLTIALAGFCTSRLCYSVYIAICCATGGLAYLLFRWLPRWYVTLVGQPCPLRTCDWVVIENQWGEMAILNTKVQHYGRSLSTIFGQQQKSAAFDPDHGEDPILDELRSLDYRYVRMCYHPLKDKYLLCLGWKDPEWTDVRSVRSGLDADEKVVRETIFGNNLIDIEQKSISSLLVDEVSSQFAVPKQRAV